MTGLVEPQYPIRRHEVPLERVQACRFAAGLLGAVLLAGGEQDLGQLDQDIGPEVEHLGWNQPDGLAREPLGLLMFARGRCRSGHGRARQGLGLGPSAGAASALRAANSAASTDRPSRRRSSASRAAAWEIWSRSSNSRPNDNQVRSSRSAATRSLARHSTVACDWARNISIRRARISSRKLCRARWFNRRASSSWPCIADKIACSISRPGVFGFQRLCQRFALVDTGPHRRPPRRERHGQQPSSCQPLAELSGSIRGHEAPSKCPFRLAHLPHPQLAMILWRRLDAAVFAAARQAVVS
jgi:hypothetical protein